MDKDLIEADKDLDEVVRLVSAKTKDVDVLRRARNRADNIREEMKTRHGKLNIAVELVNEARDSK